MFSLVKYLKPYKRQVILGPLFKLLEAVFELIIPTLMVNVIDEGVKKGDQNYIIRMSLWMLLIAFLGLIFAVIAQHAASVASQGFGTILRNKLFQKIESFPFARLNKFSSSTLVNRITNDVNVLQQAVAMLIRLVIRAPFICIGSLVMAMLLDFSLALIILALIPLLALVIYLVMSRSVPYYQKAQKKLDRLSLTIRENLSGVRVIRAFARTEDEKDRFNGENDGFTENFIRVGRISALLRPGTTLLMNFGILAVLWFGGVRVEEGRMTQGEIVAFINYMVYILNSLIIVANLIVLFTRASASGNRVSEILSVKENDFPLEKNERDLDSNISLELRNVSFSYGTGKPAIRNISIKLRKGESLGVIGGTGDGKSTLIHLIPRFFEATDGVVVVNGRDVREWNTAALRRKIAIVLQKPEIFSGTAADNIRMGKPDAREEEVRTAADAAQASAFILQKPEGFDSIIERGGANLSGGQKQRLSIARALVRRPEILILDDSTSALDYATEAALRKALKSYAQDMTLIIVSQRISSVCRLDKIIVMDDGEIVGQGNHEALMESCEQYREICESQDSGGEGRAV